MSIKTTHYVTREFALEAIKLKLDQVDDQALADLLETTLHNGFYNFRVISEEEMKENSEREWPSRVLNDINNLPNYNDAG